VGHLVAAAEPARQVEVDERRPRAALVRQTRRDPDLALRGREGGIQPELADGARHPEDEQGLGLLGAQAAKGKTVSVQQLAAPARTRFGADGHACGPECLEVAVDRPDGDLELLCECHGGRPSPGLEQEHQGHQAVGAHKSRLEQIADIRCQR
jgi:hypothetical protein